MSGGMIGGGGVDPPTTTKGDVSGFDTTFARIPIGVDSTVLTADSTEALGLKWATAATGLGKARAVGSDVLSSNGTSMVIDSLSLDMEDDYSSIQINVWWITAGTRGDIGLKINDKTSYSFDYIRQDSGTMEQGSTNSASTFEIIDSGGSGSYYGSATIIIHNHNGTGLMIHGQNVQQLDSSSLIQGYVSGITDSTITKIEITCTNDVNSGSGMNVSGILQ